jgi:hypothetical protein
MIFRRKVPQSSAVHDFSSKFNVPQNKVPVPAILRFSAKEVSRSKSHDLFPPSYRFPAKEVSRNSRVSVFLRKIHDSVSKFQFFYARFTIPFHAKVSRRFCPSLRISCGFHQIHAKTANIAAHPHLETRLPH